MATIDESDSGKTLRSIATATLLSELDLRRLRSTDVARFWPSTRIALCLMADCATAALAGELMAIVRLGDALCSGND